MKIYLTDISFQVLSKKCHHWFWKRYAVNDHKSFLEPVITCLVGNGSRVKMTILTNLSEMKWCKCENSFVVNDNMSFLESVHK